MVIGLINFGSGKKHTFISIKKIGTHGMTLIEKGCFREIFRKKESPSPKNKTLVLLHHACTVNRLDHFSHFRGVFDQLYLHSGI